MMREVAEDVTGLIVPESAHWVPEEKPELLIPTSSTSCEARRAR
jgi:hypothetical protein